MWVSHFGIHCVVNYVHSIPCAQLAHGAHQVDVIEEQSDIECTDTDGKVRTMIMTAAICNNCAAAITLGCWLGWVGLVEWADGMMGIIMIN
jgi:hypothetical protein